VSFEVRSGQREFERGVRQHRVSGLLARRQYGKTTIASRIALRKMMKEAGHDVIFGSVKIDLAREIVRKEAAALQKAIASLAEDAAAAEKMLAMADAATGQRIETLSADDFAEMYEASRLEMRLYFSNSVYSRTKVVALTPDAVGETGDLILDEIGRGKKFREVLEAVMPIISSNPAFRCIYTTTPPPDDTHPSYDLLAPPIDTPLPINPRGNWYKSALNVHVLRITAEDAYADGVPLYDDDTGEPISPTESRARSADRDAWDRNYGCLFITGGTGACGLQQLDTAQRRGIGRCRLIQVQHDSDMDGGIRWLLDHLGAGRVGLGWDLATTTNATSNPSALTVLEEGQDGLIAPAIFTWKTADPDTAMERCRAIVRAVRARSHGGPGRRLCIDATNERYFAQSVRKELGAEIPVELVVGSETVEVPGRDETMTMKQFLGGMLVAELDDNHLTLPPERYVRDDWRLVKKEKGLFVCVPDVNGAHGDTFDSTKLAKRALVSTGGAIVDPSSIRMGGNQAAARPMQFQPRRLAR
jgi:hypothetical protein